ncbi:hypothetical protein Poli38472_004182 [Pythium oligandrum]|uniref:Anoctamin dimerisation domain-containing protein n=1 Tax=Pythium oligandrum TaxID=41045 RepID=A0A8K1CPT2_PYTOL|nr:hypothetical protein Poli38472_004182 [Pythium oligandrum]|eukprot:TMW66417.1 hypothetical protein Poli38472_004182 [Pythium oligandrum]
MARKRVSAATRRAAVLMADKKRSKMLKHGYGTVDIPTEHWDYVMVFPDPPKEDVEPHLTRESIIMKLRAVGLETKLFYSSGKEMVFCKVRAPEERLKDEAERMKLRLLLDADELKHTADKGLPEYGIKPFPIRDIKQTYPYGPYQFIYAPYIQAPDAQRFFHRKGPSGSLFSSTERMQIIEHIIINHTNGAGCDLEQMLYDGIIIECYPLHDEEVKMDLKKKWIVWNTSPMEQPFEEIWEYFGVKVSLYFLFLGHCTKWLTYPAIIGIVPAVLNYVVSDAYTTEVFTYISPAFGAFMTVWMNAYLEHWKRVNARASLRWGTTDFEEIDMLRPQFKGESIPSPIDGSTTRWFSDREKLKRVAFSWLIISFLCLIVFAVVAAIFYLRWDLTKGHDAEALTIYNFKLGAMVAAFANVVQITVMGKIYNYIAIYLVDQENHRTDVEYENSLIIKTVIFQFVNNYAALFYVAFIKEGVEGCATTCMWELQYTYATVYLSRLFTSNMSEVAIPRLWVYINKYRLTGSIREEVVELAAEMSHAEKELFMASYDWRGTFDDYTEMVIQFGFTTMFVVAFPLSPLLSYLNNYFEIRLDAYRLIFESRRPRPQKVKDIGYWYQVLQAFTAISICTNGGVVIFTGDYFNGVSTAMRVWFFTLFISSMFFLKYLLEAVIYDVPRGVKAQLRRQDFLVGKVLYHVPDEDLTPAPEVLKSDLENPQAALAIADHDDDE